MPYSCISLLNVNTLLLTSADHFKANVANLPTKNFTSNIVTNQERDLPATATVSKALTNPGELTRDATQKPGEREPDFLVQPHEGSTVPEKSLKDINKTPENFQNAYSSLIKQAQVANDAATGMISSGLRAKTSSAEVDLRLTEKVEKITEGQIKPAVSSGNTGMWKTVIPSFTSSTFKLRFFQDFCGFVYCVTSNQI